jgi:hypothetical protein
MMPHNEVVLFDGVIHMTKRTFEEIRKQIPTINKYRV